jgi:hypothetical protein
MEVFSEALPKLVGIGFRFRALGHMKNLVFQSLPMKKNLYLKWRNLKLCKQPVNIILLLP